MLHYLNVSSTVIRKNACYSSLFFLLVYSENRGQILKLVSYICRSSKDSTYKYSYSHYSEKIKVRIQPDNPQNKGRESSTQCDGVVLQGVMRFDSTVSTVVSELVFSTE